MKGNFLTKFSITPLSVVPSKDRLRCLAAPSENQPQDLQPESSDIYLKKAHRNYDQVSNDTEESYVKEMKMYYYFRITCS